MSRFRVLLVDDDPEFVERFIVFGEERFGISTVATAAAAIELLSRESFDALLLDIDLGWGLSGLDLLRRIRATSPDIPVLMVSGDERAETIVEAIKAGANDYVSKTPDLEVLRLKIEHALADSAWREHARAMQVNPTILVVGQSPAMNTLRDQIARIAPLNMRVLIRGETGTGKELIAAAVHSGSPRRHEKLLKMNGAVGTDDLFDSDLFGHEKGSFTGADGRRRGRLELAHRGTLFLDEVGRMTTGRQAKLLRVVESGRFERIGGSEELACDVRLITASNDDLEQAIANERFLEDLYYRLAEYVLRVPPLRERLEDIPALVRTLADRFAHGESMPKIQWTDGALEPLFEDRWPGNVRQLDATIKAAAVLAGSRPLTADDFREALAGRRFRERATGGQGPQLSEFVGSDYSESRQKLEDAFDRLILARALAASDGNVARAAKRLGISRDTFYVKLNRLGLAPRTAE
jgi:DNA-binding NtrC family response regulator